MQQTLLSFMGKKEIYPTIFYLDNSNNDYNVYLDNTLDKRLLAYKYAGKYPDIKYSEFKNKLNNINENEIKINMYN